MAAPTNARPHLHAGDCSCAAGGGLRYAGAMEVVTRRGWLDTGDHRLRTLLTLPGGSGRVPVLLLLPSLGGRSLDVALAPPREALGVLIGAAACAGLATLRIEPSGYGGSGGPGYAQLGLEQELRGYGAALGMLRDHPRIDASAIVLFGHSLGGALAPLVAAQDQVRAVVVYGAPGRSWSRTLAAGARRQLELAQVPRERAQREAGHAAALYTGLLQRGRTADALFAEQPQLRSCQAARDVHGSLLHGRSLRFFRALEGRLVEAAWRAVDAPVLALAGEHDWVVADDDAKRIAGFVRAAGRVGQALTIAGLDHDMRRYQSRLMSFRQRGTGPLDRAAVAAMLDWLGRVAGMAVKKDTSTDAVVLSSS